MAASQPPQSAHPPQPDSSAGDPELSWEGDKMFNIYIYDYCSKRGYRKTARELLIEAEIPPDSTPPINAKQGLLFEWWSVFWVLFTAKSSGSGTEEAMLYTQHQLLQTRQAAAQRMQPNSQFRFAGAVPRGPTSAMSPPAGGPLPNGTTAGPGGHTGPPPLAFPMQGQIQAPQINGMTGSSAQLGGANGQGGAGNASSASPAPTGNTAQSNQPQHRPLGPATQRPPFQSPTMANSPGAPNPQQGTGAAGSHPGVMAHLPMNVAASQNLAQMNRSNMQHPMNGITNQMGGGPQTPSTFPSSSRSATPAQGSGPGVTQPSPSLAPRQAQAQTPTHATFNMSQTSARNNAIEQLNMDFAKIDPGMISQAKNELGISKDTATLTVEEKSHIIHHTRQRHGSVSGTGTSSPNIRNQGQPHSQPNRPGKRNSTSPTDEAASLPKSDSSPRDPKRVRQSPSMSSMDANNTNAGPSTGNLNANPMHPFPNMPNQAMMNGPNGPVRPMNGYQGQPPLTPQLPNMNQNQAMMSHLPGGGGLQMGQPIMQSAQMPFRASAQYHQSMQVRHKIDQPYNHPDNHRQNPPFVGSGLIPPPNAQGANNARPGGPMVGGMMPPPPSPAPNGLSKNTGLSGQGSGAKQDLNNRPESLNTPRMDGSSPHPPQPNQASNNGPGPGTPAPAPAGPSVTAPSPSQNSNRVSPPTLSNNPPRPATVTGNGNNNSGPAANPPPAPPPSAPPAPSQSTTTDLSEFMSDSFPNFSFLQDAELTFDDFGWINPSEDVQLDFK